MGSWHKGTGRLIPGLALAAFMLLALLLSARQSAGSASPQNPSKTNTAPDADNSSDSAGNPIDSGKNNGQPSPSQQPGAQQSTTDSQKDRLAVNPVTGLVTSSASNYSPLTGKERLRVYWKQTYFSVGAYFRPVFLALVLDQTTNSPSQWGGGFSGFGRRVASRIASNMIQGTIRAPLAAALHEDVRYVYSSRRGVKRRILHAVKYSFLTYNDQAHPTLNIAKLVGYYASTAISTTWLPGRHSVPGYTFTNGSEQIGLSVPVNILQEFWPELSRKFTHRR